MSNRVKDAIVTLSFILILVIVFLINIIKEDKLISESERRKLASFPEITKSTITNGDLSQKFESYFADQFVGRDSFRSLKSFISLNVLKNKDNNELFEKYGSIYKMDYKINEKALQKSADKINEVYNKYLKGMNVYYSVIPDKNYYLENDDHLKMDYDKVVEIMENSLEDMKYIDISDSLDLDDYYKTDLHWKQENLSNVVNTLENKMNLNESKTQDYEVKNIGEFYGVYFGQLGVNVEPDEIYTLTNSEIENCVTFNFENNKKGKVYEESNSSDKYDIYLSGPVALLKVENPNSESDKELLLFRDSFGSSLAPLLLKDYKTITLIDLRYVSSKILDYYIKFENQDVLFLYSTLVLNQNILR